MRNIYSVLLIALLLTTGNALAYEFSSQPRASAGTQIGIIDWNNLSDYGSASAYDLVENDNPVATVNETISVTSPVNLGTFSGSASASAQGLKAELSMPAIPGDWNPDPLDFNFFSESSARYTDWLYYPGDTGTYGEVTLHFDITGVINFSDTEFSGDPMRMEVFMAVYDPVQGLFPAGETIFDNIHAGTWVGKDFYETHNIDYGFDRTVGFEFGEENQMEYFFQIYVDYFEPGAPATTMDFSNTATCSVEKLTDPDGLELPLIDPSSGVGLLESASGTDYVVPIPSAIWLLGSAFIGLLGFRRNFKKA